MEIIKKTTDGNESTLRMYRINIFLNKFKYKWKKMRNDTYIHTHIVNLLKTEVNSSKSWTIWKSTHDGHPMKKQVFTYVNNKINLMKI